MQQEDWPMLHTFSAVYCSSMSFKSQSVPHELEQFFVIFFSKRKLFIVAVILPLRMNLGGCEHFGAFWHCGQIYKTKFSGKAF